MFSSLYGLSLDPRFSRKCLFWIPIVLINVTVPMLLSMSDDFSLSARIIGVLTWVIIALFGISYGYQRLKNILFQKSLFSAYVAKTLLAVLAIFSTLLGAISAGNNAIIGIFGMVESGIAMMIGTMSIGIVGRIMQVITGASHEGYVTLGGDPSSGVSWLETFSIVIVDGVLTNLVITVMALIFFAGWTIFSRIRSQ